MRLKQQHNKYLEHKRRLINKTSDIRLLFISGFIFYFVCKMNNKRSSKFLKPIMKFGLYYVTTQLRKHIVHYLIKSG
jgi:hypothetical protein